MYCVDSLHINSIELFRFKLLKESIHFKREYLKSRISLEEYSDRLDSITYMIYLIDTHVISKVKRGIFIDERV